MDLKIYSAPAGRVLCPRLGWCRRHHPQAEPGADNRHGALPQHEAHQLQQHRGGGLGVDM